MIGFTELGYLGLFIASFLAATVVPFSSEAVFLALVALGFDLWTCVFVATAGNQLGGMTCYYLGRLGKLEWIEKYTGVKKEKIDKLADRVQKYGNWLVFFSFLPAIGDVIVVAAGFFRCNFWLVFFIMLIGKFFRYLLLMYLGGLIFG